MLLSEYLNEVLVCIQNSLYKPFRALIYWTSTKENLAIFSSTNACIVKSATTFEYNTTLENFAFPIYDMWGRMNL